MRRIGRLMSAWLLVLVALPAVGSEGVWFVSPGGDDGTGTGSASAPFKTIGRAVNEAAAGDTIRVLPGLYRECVAASGKSLHFVATAIEADPPSNLLTIVDGTGTCGGSSCAERKTLACYGTGEENCRGFCNNLVCSITQTQRCLVNTDCPAGETCSITVPTGLCTNDRAVTCKRNLCLIEQGNVTGNCENHPTVECYYDSECANLDCDFGACTRIEGTCSVSSDWCAGSADCAEEESCDSFSPAPTFDLDQGSTVTGFTIYGGGLSGVRLAGSGAISRNRIDYNRATGADGGGVVLEPAAAPPPTACWGDSSLLCADDAACSVCHDDPAVACATDQDCADADAGATCDGLGPCVASTEVALEDNLIRNNVADAAGPGHGGGAVCLRAAPAAGAGTRLVASGNDVSGNASGGDGGAILALAAGEGRFHARLEDNAVASNRGEDGGAVAVRVSLLGAASRADVEFVGNVLEYNEATGSGGGALAELSIGEGSAFLFLSDNDVRGNDAGADGGGFLARVAGDGAGERGIDAVGNRVSGNHAAGSGGGLDLALAEGASSAEASALTATGNDIVGNGAGVGGGGLRAAIVSSGSVEALTATVGSNSVRKNTAGSYGAGVVLVADSEGPAGASARFDRNLVSENSAVSESGGYATGGGLFLYLRGGAGEASAAVDYVTITANFAEEGAAAIEIESDGAPGGSARVTVTNSILAGNDGIGIGGPPTRDGGKLMAPGARDLEIDVRYTDVWGNTGVGYERTIASELTRDETDFEENPKLSNDFVPALCSPVIDAADPAGAFSLEPLPNGSRANLGHLGGTEAATPTVPDLNRDLYVDGMDLLRIASAWAADRELTPDRFFAPADIDGNGVVDGADLAYLAAFFGFTCP